MAIWEQVLLGIGAFVLLFMFWPGVKAAMERSKAVEKPDWTSALIPIGLVVVFIVVLIAIARN